MSRALGAISTLQYNFLRWLFPKEPSVCTGQAWTERSKLDLLGTSLDVAHKTVIDFGCGEGQQSIELAKRGAGRVIGIDIRPELLQHARKLAHHHGVSKRCEFASATQEQADLIISLDAFEHFANPDEILHIMSRLLKSAGAIRASFGPTWFHPLGVIFFPCSPGLISSFRKTRSLAGAPISKMTAQPASARLLVG